jgi:hypothetical protein
MRGHCENNRTTRCTEDKKDVTASVRAAVRLALLIHGTIDTNIVPLHSRELHAANLAATELWEVPAAGHIASLGTVRAEYIARVLAWFDRHR